MSALLGKRVAVLISEPWEWANEHRHDPPPIGEIIAEEPRPFDPPYPIVLVKLDAPLVFKDIKWEYLVVQSRHAGEPLTLILEGEAVLSNMQLASEPEAMSDHPCANTSYRGGFLIGGIRLDPLP